jgi:ribose transport system substrate-binding protein
MSRVRALSVFFMVFALAVAGCGSGGQTAPAGDKPAPEKKIVIGAALLTQTHVFFQDLAAAMQDEAKAQGIELRVQYAEFDSGKQNNQMETFTTQGVSAIVVSPCDSAGIAPVIAEARAKNIPVFTVDIAAHGADVVSHIASDNVKGGELVGDYLAKLLNNKGKVAIIDHREAASVQERVSGFLKALEKFPEIQIVQRVPGEGQRDKALKAAQDLLQSTQDLNAVFGINDDSALGALAAVEAAGLQDKVFIVGYDGTPEARAAILAGKALKADTVQFPKKIGQQSIQTVMKHLKGETVPPVVPVEVGLIDQESLKAEGK